MFAWVAKAFAICSPSNVGRIQVLPAALASQIAAGEVVERPASAVKELIENALDAEATRCDVCCNGGGVSFLSVSDDGLGMSDEDARLCVERHATSKLTALSDLNQMSTFGFRGEALPSIASVSRFTLHTRARDAEVGLRIEIEAGNRPKIMTEGMKIGTTIEIRDLFFNVPARRKFLRSTGTESAHVTTAVEGASLCRFDVTFTLTRDGRKVRELLRASSRRERVEGLLTEESLTSIRGERGPMRLEAHLSRPERARPGASGLWLIVNGRVIKDRMIAATVAQAYGGSLPSGNYPRGVIYVDLPPELVDVNVHPQKTEVRFVDPRALSDAIYSILSRELSAAFSLPQGTRGGKSRAEQRPPPQAALLPVERPFIPGYDKKFGAPEAEARHVRPDLHGNASVAARPDPRAHTPLTAHSDLRVNEPVVARQAFGATIPSAEQDPDIESGENGESGENDGATPASSRLNVRANDADACAPDDNEDIEPAPVTLVTPPSEAVLGVVMEQLNQDRDVEPVASASNKNNPKNFGKLKFLAQVKLTFLVCEGSDGLYVIDQHAAAERVAFAKLLAQYQSRAMAAQALLFPVMIDLLPAEIDILEDQLETFRALGLDARVRSKERISVHSAPRLLQRASPERLVRDLLGEMTKSGGRGFSSAIEQAIALMACHGSLRAGEPLSSVQAQALLTSLDEVDQAPQCTHGRPVVAVMRFTDLERQVGRR